MVDPTAKADIQTHSDGAGPLYHRVYAIDVPVSYERALKTMHDVMVNPNAFSPQLIATFEKTKGRPDRLAVDDEFIVHISGPWDGPVRVSQVSDASFTLLTLKSHIEAGHIQFRLISRENDLSRFEIESVTRSRDTLVNFFYDKLRLAQFAQTEMWELFCKQFASQAISETKDGESSDSPLSVPAVEVKTERQDRETGQWMDVSDQLGANGIS